MKQIVLLLLMVLLANCTTNKIKRYQSDRLKWKGIIYEGVSVDGVMLGDSRDLVKNLLGEPEFVWTNESSKHDFVWKYMFVEDTRLFQPQHRYITLYLTNQKKIVTLSNPLFDYSYVYYSRGITLFFDKYDKVVEIIVLFENPTHRTEIKGNVSWSKTEYKPYTDKFWYGNITASNATLGHLFRQYKKAVPKSYWILPTDFSGEHKDKIFVGENSPFLKPFEMRKQTAIYFKNNKLDDPKNKVTSLKMHSPMLGVWIDSYNPWEPQHVGEAIERRKKYIKKYGHKYY